MLVITDLGFDESCAGWHEVYGKVYVNNRVWKISGSVKLIQYDDELILDHDDLTATSPKDDAVGDTCRRVIEIVQCAARAAIPPYRVEGPASSHPMIAAQS